MRHVSKVIFLYLQPPGLQVSRSDWLQRIFKAMLFTQLKAAFYANSFEATAHVLRPVWTRVTATDIYFASSVARLPTVIYCLTGFIRRWRYRCFWQFALADQSGCDMDTFVYIKNKIICMKVYRVLRKIFWSERYEVKGGWRKIIWRGASSFKSIMLGVLQLGQG
jgi:hypothetical protein